MSPLRQSLHSLQSRYLLIYHRVLVKVAANWPEEEVVSLNRNLSNDIYVQCLIMRQGNANRDIILQSLSQALDREQRYLIKVQHKIRAQTARGQGGRGIFVESYLVSIQHEDSEKLGCLMLLMRQHDYTHAHCSGFILEFYEYILGVKCIPKKHLKFHLSYGTAIMSQLPDNCILIPKKGKITTRSGQVMKSLTLNGQLLQV